MKEPMNEPKRVLTVQISNGYAYVSEDTTHVAELTVEDKDRKIVGDVNVIGADEKWGVAWLSTEKMLRHFEVDAGGPMWVTLARLNSVYQAFSQGKTLDAPVMFSSDGASYGILIMDGRHRTKALHNLGARKIPVMVPESQVELFKVELG